MSGGKLRPYAYRPRKTKTDEETKRGKKKEEKDKGKKERNRRSLEAAKAANKTKKALPSEISRDSLEG